MAQKAMICRTTDPYLQMLYSARAHIYSMAVAAAVQGPGQQAVHANLPRCICFIIMLQKASL